LSNALVPVMMINATLKTINGGRPDNNILIFFWKWCFLGLKEKITIECLLDAPAICVYLWQKMQRHPSLISYTLGFSSSHRPGFFERAEQVFSEHTSLLLFHRAEDRLHVSIYSWCFKQKIDPEKLERWRYSVLIRPHFCLSPLCPSVVNFIVFIEIWLGISLLAINIIGRKVDVVAL
jgi:hypothetical protein